jgi:hypothetical protein
MYIECAAACSYQCASALVKRVTGYAACNVACELACAALETPLVIPIAAMSAVDTIVREVYLGIGLCRIGYDGRDEGLCGIDIGTAMALGIGTGIVAVRIGRAAYQRFWNRGAND